MSPPSPFMPSCVRQGAARMIQLIKSTYATHDMIIASFYEATSKFGNTDIRQAWAESRTVERDFFDALPKDQHVRLVFAMFCVLCRHGDAITVKSVCELFDFTSDEFFVAAQFAIMGHKLNIFKVIACAFESDLCTFKLKIHYDLFLSAIKCYDPNNINSFEILRLMFVLAPASLFAGTDYLRQLDSVGLTKPDIQRLFTNNDQPMSCSIDIRDIESATTKKLYHPLASLLKNVVLSKQQRKSLCARCEPFSPIWRLVVANGVSV
jgi:hypothetical protein